MEILSVSQGEVDAVHQCPEWQANNTNTAANNASHNLPRITKTFSEIQCSYMQILGVGKVEKGENMQKIKML